MAQMQKLEYADEKIKQWTNKLNLKSKNDLDSLADNVSKLETEIERIDLIE